MGGRRCIWGEHVDAWACTRVRADAALEVHGEVVEAARSTRAGTWTLSASAGSRTSSLVRRGMTTWRLACAHQPSADKMLNGRNPTILSFDDLFDSSRMFLKVVRWGL